MKIYCSWHQRRILNKKKFTFVFEIKLSFAEEESLDDHFTVRHLDNSSILKFKIIGATAESFDVVEAEADPGFDLPMDAITPPLEIIRPNGWVVADLLQINRAPVYSQLDGLPQDGVEGLLKTDA